MIDVKAITTEPPEMSSISLETTRAGVTRFYWIRACENCLSRSTYTLNGVAYCQGCSRQVVFGQHEGGPPE